MSRPKIILIIFSFSFYLITGFLLSFHEPYLVSSCMTIGEDTICEQNKISKKEWFLTGLKIIPVWPLVLSGVVK